jgi:hypothetical protein
MKYFADGLTIEECRKQFRELCLQLHPDKGGKHEDFIAMKNEYDIAIKLLAALEAGNANRENRKTRFTFESEKALREKIEELLNIPAITIEICGSWLWISGNTFPVHDRIKAAGCKFSGAKKLWYFAVDMAQGRVRGRYSMAKIRNKFGSMTIESEAEPQYQLAG